MLSGAAAFGLAVDIWREERVISCARRNRGHGGCRVVSPTQSIRWSRGHALRLASLRLLCYTINDSLRLRTGLTRALCVAPGSVDAWAIGEHGDLSVPLFDRVTVNGEPVRPTAEQAAAAEEDLRTWYVKHVALDSGRSSTWTSGLGVARMVAALDGDGEVWPASVVLDGEYGVDGVALTVPVTIGRGGVRQIHEWELAPPELDALHAAAELVRTAVVSLD
jgi:malate dehydrogenase